MYFCNVRNIDKNVLCHHYEFNQELNDWDTQIVINMEYMFHNCTIFNQPLNEWNVSKVRNMVGLFSGCSEFNQNINS